MCGRVACSLQSIERAKGMLATATSLRRDTRDDSNSGEKFCHDGSGNSKSTNDNNNIATPKSNLGIKTDDIAFQTLKSCKKEEYNNWNLSPGMKSIIFHLEKNYHRDNGCTADVDGNNRNEPIITYTEQTWGLVPRSGTVQNPIPIGPSKHFSNLMFNARSDTLYDKRTFRELALHKKQSCIWAIDGYYEWKQPDGDVFEKEKKKQPYYVHRKDAKPLFIPGLWTSIRTGRGKSDKDSGIGNCNSEETLETFTMLTTDAKPSLRWLHHRQPVMIHDVEVAIDWICNPNKLLLQQISSSQTNDSNEKIRPDISHYACNRDDDEVLAWYPVTKRMSKVNYRNKDCVDAIKIEKVPSIKSFFGNLAGGASTASNSKGTHPSKINGASNHSKSEAVSKTAVNFKKRKLEKGNTFYNIKGNKKRGLNNKSFDGSDKHSKTTILSQLQIQKKKEEKNEIIDLTGDVTPSLSQQEIRMRGRSYKRHSIANYFMSKTKK